MQRSKPLEIRNEQPFNVNLNSNASAFKKLFKSRILLQI